MIVICLAELVLDKNAISISSTYTRNNICSEIADPSLSLFEQKRASPKSQSEGQFGEVFGLCEPR
jgi:hypothetical protein